MGQLWTIYNLDKRMRIAFMGKFGPAFSGGSYAASLAKLISSARLEFPKDPLEGQPYIEARKYQSSQTGICDLPCELQDAIFSELSDPVDVVAFCLTASHFWRIGLSHYKALYTDHVRHAEDWSDDRLICMGDYADDWPEGLITNEDFESLKASYIYYYDCEPDSIGDLLSVFTQSLHKLQWPYSYNFTRRCELTEWNPSSRQLQERFKKSRAFKLHLSSLAHDEPLNDLPEFLPLYKYDFAAWLDLPEFIRKYGPGDHCVLRNLSKKVYVRRDALALKSEDASDTSIHYMSFGSLVLARIPWSRDPSMAMAYAANHDLHRGIWAGDRFDIVNVEAMEHDDGWTDVSAAARNQLNDMWEDVFGADWESKLRNSKAEPNTVRICY